MTELPGAGARDRMVRGAAALLARDGLAGVSFGSVLNLTGAPRGSIYHHFPGGKEELVSEAVRRAGQSLLTALDELPVQATAGDVARAFTGIWRALLERYELASGCAVAAVVTSAEASTAEASAASAVIRSWATALAGLLEAAGLGPAAALALARTLIAGVEGALIVARAERSLAPYDQVSDSLVLLADTMSAA